MAESRSAPAGSAPERLHGNPGAGALASREARCPDPGPARRKGAQMERESATGRFVRLAVPKAIPFRRTGHLPSRYGRQSIPPSRRSLPRSGMRPKEPGTKRAGISDGAHRTIRCGKGNLETRSRSPTVAYGRQSLPPSLSSLPRSGMRPKELGTKRAGISDRAHRAIRCGKGNPSSLSAAPGVSHGAYRVNSAGRLWLSSSQHSTNRPERSASAPQSIIAALRMHTIVACAGFSLRLRMRWGISQR